MIFRRLAIAFVVVALSSAVAHAQPGNTASQLSQAADALRKGDHVKAGALSAPIAQSVDTIGKQDRAEAWRIYALSLYFAKRLQDSERAFVEFLKLKPNAHLEPSLVAPEAIIFFESVRSRNAATLHQYRPKSKTKRRWILNWLPPAGQVQNGQRTKAVVIGITGVMLMAANLTTFFMLRDWCDESTGVCTNSAGESVRSKAKTFRAINLSTAAAFGALYAYAVIDGLVYFRRKRTKKSVSVGVVPGPDGAYVSILGRF